MSLSSSVTTLSSLSPLLTYTPCITCDWTEGWIQGWNSTDAHPSDNAQRYAEGWAVGQDLGLEWEFQGTSLSLLLTPTPAYSLSLSINDTVVRALPDLASSATVNVTDLALGTHRVRAAFSSVDKGRQISQDTRVRVLGVELGWEGESVNSTTLDDSAPAVSFSAGWNRMSSANTTGNVENATAAAVLEPHLQSFSDQSLSWTSYNGSSLTMTFTGTFITLLTPLLPSLGTFTPILDGVALPDVNLAKNLPNQTLDASLIYNQVGWHRAGLADGPHTFEMRNVGGQVKGTGGQMMVDAFMFGRVGQLPLSAPSSSSALPSSTAASSSATPSSTSSSDSFLPLTNVSTSIGIFFAIGVGGLAVIGLATLLFYKCLRRRRDGASGGNKHTTSSFVGGGAGGMKSILISNPTRPFSSANPKPFRDDATGGGGRGFQALTSPPSAATFASNGFGDASGRRGSAVNLLAASGSGSDSSPPRSKPRLSQLPSWTKPSAPTPTPPLEMREPKPVFHASSSSSAIPRLSTAAVPLSAASVYPPSDDHRRRSSNAAARTDDSFYLRPMSEAGEVGDFSSSAAPSYHHENRTSSFSAFDPPSPARRPSLPFEDQHQDRNEQSHYLVPTHNGDDDDDARDRRQTVATSIGSMYPDDSASSVGPRQESTYSLGESYFDLEEERRRTGLAMGSPSDVARMMGQQEQQGQGQGQRGQGLGGKGYF